MDTRASPPTISSATLTHLSRRRSTSAPPKIPMTKAGNATKAPVNPVFAALPVVCNTNQGIAIALRELPISENALAASSAASGRRCRGTLASSYPVAIVQRDQGTVCELQCKSASALAVNPASAQPSASQSPLFHQRQPLAVASYVAVQRPIAIFIH